MNWSWAHEIAAKIQEQIFTSSVLIPWAPLEAKVLIVVRVCAVTAWASLARLAGGWAVPGPCTWPSFQTPFLPEKEWDGLASLLLPLRAPSNCNGTCQQDHGRGLRHIRQQPGLYSSWGHTRAQGLEEQRPHGKAVSRGRHPHTLSAASTASLWTREEGRRHVGAHVSFPVLCSLLPRP